ncbi:MAG: acyltransferase [Planctomycetes bacterium]|nr:acyltransferase [Planctomycetota bacterium]
MPPPVLTVCLDSRRIPDTETPAKLNSVVILQAAAPESNEPSWLRRGHVPALDGLRGLSILLVLLGHGTLSHNFPFSDSSGALHRLSAVGVDMFFVISGFLITLLLLRERDRQGGISLKGFYWRRALRILPAYVAYLAFLFITTRLDLVALQLRDWLGALTYTVNFMPGAAWEVGHLWSLSVEEHFYLAWPLVFMLLGNRCSFLLAAALVIAGPFIRLGLWSWEHNLVDVDYCTPARMDTIASGCCLAFLAMRSSFRQKLGIFADGRGVLAVAGFILVANILLQGRGRPEVMLLKTCNAVGFAAVVWLGASAGGSLIGCFLNCRLLVALGTLSYSLYLWQQPFLDPHQSRWFASWPWNLLCVFAAALACHWLVERPFLKLKGGRIPKVLKSRRLCVFQTEKSSSFNDLA